MYNSYSSKTPLAHWIWIGTSSTPTCRKMSQVHTSTVYQETRAQDNPFLGTFSWCCPGFYNSQTKWCHPWEVSCRNTKLSCSWVGYSPGVSRWQVVWIIIIHIIMVLVLLVVVLVVFGLLLLLVVVVVVVVDVVVVVVVVVVDKLLTSKIYVAFPVHPNKLICHCFSRTFSRLKYLLTKSVRPFASETMFPCRGSAMFCSRRKKGNGNMASGCPVSENLGYDFSRTVLTVHNRCVLKIGDCNMLQPGSS